MADYKVTVNGPFGTAGYCRWCYHIEGIPPVTIQGKTIGINLPRDIPIVDPADSGYPFGAAGLPAGVVLTPPHRGNPPTHKPRTDNDRQVVSRSVPMGQNAIDICFLVPTVNGICGHNATTSTKLEYDDGTNWVQLDFVDGNKNEYPHGHQRNRMTKEIDGPLAAPGG
ncbi:MAG: hypothetical protein WCC70_10910 [Candidatus Aquilonibacter sp.]